MGITVHDAEQNRYTVFTSNTPILSLSSLSIPSKCQSYRIENQEWYTLKYYELNTYEYQA